MAIVYIIYSPSIDKFYTGFSTESIEIRLQRHNDDYYNDKWTSKGKPWQVHLTIECKSDLVASKIEMHIKSMKSKKYMANLKLYPEIVQKLKLKYSNG